jgi:hypothetical protein
VARNALLATHGGLSLELCAVIWHISPMALSRLVCAFGQHSVVTVLTRCGLPLPPYFIADEKHSRCLTAKVYLPTNWLRVLGSAELAQIDQRVGHQLHAIMPLLDTFKAEQESLEFIFPGKGALDAHPQGMNGGVEQAFASALRGLAVAGILFDVGNQAGIENALPIVRGIKTTIEVKVGSTEIYTHLFGHLFQRFQALR